MSEKQFKVLGYVKPTSSFHTIKQWHKIANKLLNLQSKGMDTRGGKISCKEPNFCNQKDYQEFVSILAKNFGYLLYSEVPKRDLLTEKNVLDFIEDLVNHRIWGLEKEFGHYFPDITKLRFAYFYSRGDLEPYVLLDGEYTKQIYGSTWNPKVVNHYTTENGLKNIKESLASGKDYDISSFTYIERPFFRKESVVCVTLVGNVRAAFRSDIKSVATDSGRRACNLYRLEYPGNDVNNVCYDLEECEDGKTSLWNEFIVTPIEITKIKIKS
jgi:hypothetical protein